MLTLKNTEVELDKQLILSLQEVTISDGQFNVLTGPSGAGKSTFLHAISGLLEPSKGSIQWRSQPLYDLSSTARAQWRNTHVGFIFQDFHLIPSLSALDNVILQYSFSRWRIADKLKQHAIALLKSYGINNIHKNIGQFSRGEKQRIALARALCGDPEIILADEPTAALDKDNADFVITQLKAQAAMGKFVLAVSHDPLVIAQATQIFHLDRGVIGHESMDVS